MSVYPYEVPLIYINAKNKNGLAGGDIIYSKEEVHKIPEKGDCQEISMELFVGCIKKKIKESLENSSKVNCMVPALEFTDFNYSGLNYCESKDDALEVDGLIYEIAQKIHVESQCGTLCNRTIYHSKFSNYLSKKAISKELEEYEATEGYYIIWAYYSSLYVSDDKETYLFDFESTLVAIGSNLGLFVGWSLFSLLMGGIEFLFVAFGTKRPLVQ